MVTIVTIQNRLFFNKIAGHCVVCPMVYLPLDGYFDLAEKQKSTKNYKTDFFNEYYIPKIRKQSQWQSQLQ